MSLSETSRVVMEKLDLFAGLPSDVLATIHSHLEPHEVAAGTVLYREGDEANCVYFVREGTIRLSKQIGGEEIRLLARSKGDMFGEMALIDSSPRLVTAASEGPARLWALSRDRYQRMQHEDPGIAARFIRLLAARVREIDHVHLIQLESKNRDLEEARRRLEQLLQRLEKTNVHLEAALAYRDRVLGVSPYPAIVTDIQNRLRLVNPAAINLFGKSPSNQLWEWIQPVYPALVSEVDTTVDGKSQWKGEVEVYGPNQKVLTCRLVVVPIIEQGDAESARLWMFEDLTEMRQLERQTVQREQLAVKGEMAGEIAHELNNYLAVLSGNAELLSMTLKDSASEKTFKRLESMSSTVDRIRVFTDNLLRSRHPAGEKAAIEINPFLENQIAFLKPQKRIKKTIIETDWGPNIPSVLCDASAIQQVFYNIILNAADALSQCRHKQPVVRVATRYQVETNNAVITVTDNGPGIPDGLLDKLFKERVSSKPTGHGFGLLTIARIVDEHGGTVSARNRDEGGAEFTITLPCRTRDGRECPST